MPDRGRSGHLERAGMEAVWPLLAEPAPWHEWALHVRGAWGLGSPEVWRGERGAERLFGVLLVPVTIVSKRAEREWTWVVPGGVSLAHRVEPDRDGSLITIELSTPDALEPLLRASYGPLVSMLVR